LERIIKITILSIIYLLCFANVYSQSIGLLDLQTVLLFHPQMKNFDINVNRFKKNNTNKSAKFLQARRKQIKQETDIERKKIMLKINELELKIANLPARKLAAQKAELEKFRSSFTTPIKSVPVFNAKKGKTKKMSIETVNLEEAKILYYKNLDKIEVKYKKLENDYRKQIKSLKQKLFEINERANSVDYFTYKETISKLNSIISEIKKEAKIVARKQKLITIINNSYKSLVAPIKYDKILPENMDTFKNYDDLLSEVYKFFRSKKSEDMGLLTTYISKAQKFYKKYKYLNAAINERCTKSFILSGGTDITFTILRRILNKHKIPKDVIEFIISSLKALKKEGE